MFVQHWWCFLCENKKNTTLEMWFSGALKKLLYIENFSDKENYKLGEKTLWERSTQEKKITFKENQLQAYVFGHMITIFPFIYLTYGTVFTNVFGPKRFGLLGWQRLNEEKKNSWKESRHWSFKLRKGNRINRNCQS